MLRSFSPAKSGLVVKVSRTRHLSATDSSRCWFTFFRQEDCRELTQTPRRRVGPPGGALASPDLNTPVAELTRTHAIIEPFRFMQDHGRIDKSDPAMAAKFAILKQRLLLERLNGTPEIETHALIMEQANEAAFRAWLSSYPLLTFPCLFEERAWAVTEQVRREASSYWHGLAAQSAARAA